MKDKSVLIYFILTFIFYLIFYTQCHPVVVSTADDWTYLCRTRDAIPVQTEHNPTRVLPEILLPFLTNVYIGVIMPLCGDFILSITIGTAMLLSLIVCIYCFTFYRFVCKKIRLDIFSSLVVVTFFQLFHFLIFRHNQNWNEWLFGSYDLVCFYYYTIPILINITLVMYLMVNDWHLNPSLFIKKCSLWKCGGLVLIIYLCIFSNLYASIIIASYIGMTLIYQYVFSHGFLNNKNFFKSNIVSFLIISCFVLTLWMESHGHNAEELTSSDMSYREELLCTLSYYCKIPAMFNKWFIIFVFFVACCYLYTTVKNKHYYLVLNNSIIIIVGCWIGCNLFSVLISARAEPSYVIWQDRMLMEFFWIIFSISIAIGFCLKEEPIIKIAIPLLFMLLFFQTNTSQRTFSDVEDYPKSIELDHQIIELMKDADRCGQDSVTFYIPNYKSSNNWPLALYMSKYIPNLLNKHSIISKPIKLKLIPVRGKKDITTWLLPSQCDSIVETKNYIKIE